MKALALIAVLVFTGLLAAPAAADGPTREVRPPDADFVTDLCGFPVLIHTEGEIVVLSFTDDDGVIVRQVITFPGASWTLTNLDTGEEIVVQLPGPGFFDRNPDGSRSFVGAGPWSWFQHPTTAEPGLFLTEGRWVISRDAQGNVSVSITGRIVDLCAELAS